MELGLRGKRVLVTGATRGVGRACAVALAAEGASVLLCARGAGGLEGLRSELATDNCDRSRGHKALAVDLMDEDGPARLALWLEHEAGGVDGVVHNLGGTLGIRDPLTATREWRRVWRFNLEIAMEINSALIPIMRKVGYGRLVFISSLAAFEHQGSVPYSVVKAALTAYVRGIGRTYAADGIVAAAVVPGSVLTEGGHWDDACKRDPAYVESYMRDRLPRGVFGTPEEVAAAVTFLCSPVAGAFVGSIVPIDGGQGRSFFGQ